MTTIHWSNKVFDEILEIKWIVAQRSERLAEAFVDKVFEKVEALKTFPKMGRTVPEFNRTDIRELIYKEYV